MGTAIANFHSVGNAIEAVLWLLIAAILLVAGFRSPASRYRCWLIAAVLIAFGISDVVEIRTGAWWRPWWLLAWKGSCIVTFILLCWKWPRQPSHEDTANPLVDDSVS